MLLATNAEVYEYLIEQAYRYIVRSGDTVVDVGANAGLHTMPLAELVEPTGRVYAFEPIPHLYHRLQRWVSKHSATVELRPHAIADREGPCEFHINMVDPSRYSGLRSQHEMSDVRYFTFRTRSCTLDTLLRDVKCLRFVKIDVDGGEMDVVRGARGVLSRMRPVIVFEFGDYGLEAYRVRAADIFALLTELGYRVGTITGIHVRTCEEFVASSAKQQVWNYFAVHETEATLLMNLAERLRLLHSALSRDVQHDARQIRSAISGPTEIAFSSPYDSVSLDLRISNQGSTALTPAFRDPSGRGKLSIGLLWSQNGRRITEERRELLCVLIPGETTSFALDLYPWVGGQYYLAPGKYMVSVQIVSEHVTWIPGGTTLAVDIRESASV